MEYTHRVILLSRLNFTTISVILKFYPTSYPIKLFLNLSQSWFWEQTTYNINTNFKLSLYWFWPQLLTIFMSSFNQLYCAKSWWFTVRYYLRLGVWGHSNVYSCLTGNHILVDVEKYLSNNILSCTNIYILQSNTTNLNFYRHWDYISYCIFFYNLLSI